MSITFKDLENFIMVAKSRTLSEASEKLEMAQPSLSLGIKKMEKDLGIPLFTRGRNGIKLTPQGKNILPEAEMAMQILGRIQGVPTNLRFRVGCHPSVGMFLLGEFLKTMHKLNPGIDMDIVNASSHEINKRVALGEIDFGLVMNPLPIPGLVTKFIGEDEVYVWEAKNRFDDRLIYNPDMIQANSILSRWKDAPVSRVEVPNLELITSLVDAGAGYGIIPSQVVKAQRFQLRKVPGTPSYKDRLAVVCFPEMLKTAEGKLIFEELKKSYRG